MARKRKTPRNHHGLQAITLCISTALVLILLGLVVFSVLTGRNLSSYMKENIVVTMMLDQNMTKTEASKMNSMLNHRLYVRSINYISKEQTLKEAIKSLGTDPAEFTDGINPFQASIDLTLKSDYANNDSLVWIVKELKKFPKVSEINYQKNFIDNLNNNIANISIILLVLAVLLTFVSFSLINNTVRLGIYARRFSIHTMKLVGASWRFIRWPFVRHSIVVGLVSSLLANAVLAGCIYCLYRFEPGILNIVTWETMVITGSSVFLFGIVITALCSTISVNKFLKMKAGELYKI